MSDTPKDEKPPPAQPKPSGPVPSPRPCQVIHGHYKEETVGLGPWGTLRAGRKLSKRRTQKKKETPND